MERGMSIANAVKQSCKYKANKIGAMNIIAPILVIS